MTNKVTVKENAKGEWEVRRVATGEVLATFDSAYLAKRMVATINARVQ